MFVFKSKQQYHAEVQLKNDTNAGGLPPLISDVITDSRHYIDNIFADTWKKLRFNSLIRGAGFTKRSGIAYFPRILIWTFPEISGLVFQKILMPDVYRGYRYL
jgi:hypothetical protein